MDYYRNTRYLLKNYQRFKACAVKSVYTAQEAERQMNIIASVFDGKRAEDEIESIKVNALNTGIIVAHIDKMLCIYEEMAKTEEEQRRVCIIKDKYIHEPRLNAIQISFKHNISERQVYYDLETAIDELTTLIFGVDENLIEMIKEDV